MSTIARPPLLRVMLFQLLVALAITGLLLFIGIVESVSFAAGSLIQLLSSAYFARQAYKYSGASQVTSLVKAMYRGTAGKIILATVMFSLLFVLAKPLNVVGIFVGYLVMQVVQVALLATLTTPVRTPK